MGYGERKKERKKKNKIGKQKEDRCGEGKK